MNDCYITLAGIYTKHPETGARNVGMYRVQVHGPRLAAMHWHTIQPVGNRLGLNVSGTRRA